jgi:hypothetical protein
MDTSPWKQNALTALFGPVDACSEGRQIGDVKLIAFPTWVPPAVRYAASKLHAQIAAEKDPAKASELLARLISDRRMEAVWQKLYRTRRVKNQNAEKFVHRAYVRHASRAARLRQLAEKATTYREAKRLENEAAAIEDEYDPLADQPWSDQDLGVQLFFWHVYRNALNLKPVFLSDLKAESIRLHELAKDLRKKAATLRSPGLKLEAPKLMEVAAACDDEASRIVPNLIEEDPWVMSRQRGDIQLRPLVADLSITWAVLFDGPVRKMLPQPAREVFADVASVVLTRNDITPSKIREMLR